MSYYRCGICGLGMASAVALAAGDRCPRCATELVRGESLSFVSIVSRFARGAAGSKEVAADGSLGSGGAPHPKRLAQDSGELERSVRDRLYPSESSEHLDVRPLEGRIRPVGLPEQPHAKTDTNGHQE